MGRVIDEANAAVAICAGQLRRARCSVERRLVPADRRLPGDDGEGARRLCQSGVKKRTRSILPPSTFRSSLIRVSLHAGGAGHHLDEIGLVVSAWRSRCRAAPCGGAARRLDPQHVDSSGCREHEVDLQVTPSAAGPSRPVAIASRKRSIGVWWHVDEERAVDALVGGPLRSSSAAVRCCFCQVAALGPVAHLVVGAGEQFLGPPGSGAPNTAWLSSSAAQR